MKYEAAVTNSYKERNIKLNFERQLHCYFQYTRNKYTWSKSRGSSFKCETKNYVCWENVSSKNGECGFELLPHVSFFSWPSTISFCSQLKSHLRGWVFTRNIEVISFCGWIKWKIFFRERDNIAGPSVIFFLFWKISFVRPWVFRFTVGHVFFSFVLTCPHRKPTV